MKKVNTSFYNDKIRIKGSYCIRLSVMLIDSVFKICRNYYLQLFLEECKDVVKEVARYIIEDLEFFSYADKPEEEELIGEVCVCKIYTIYHLNNR